MLVNKSNTVPDVTVAVLQETQEVESDSSERHSWQIKEKWKVINKKISNFVFSIYMCIYIQVEQKNVKFVVFISWFKQNIKYCYIIVRLKANKLNKPFHCIMLMGKTQKWFWIPSVIKIKVYFSTHCNIFYSYNLNLP